MRSIVDLAIARALRRSLEPRFDAHTVGAELVQLVEGRPRPLERAIVRVDVAQAERGSWVAERARQALADALEQLVPSFSLTPVPVRHAPARHAPARLRADSRY